MPTRMNGVEAGTTTRAKIVPSFAPSTRAAFRRVRSTCTTPWNVEITQARNEARKITNTLGCSPIPISTIASGMIASGGMVRKNCTQGSSSPRAQVYHPIRKPTGIASSVPSRNPEKTRSSEAAMSWSRMPEVARSIAATTTSGGPGICSPNRDSSHHTPRPRKIVITFRTRRVGTLRRVAVVASSVATTAALGSADTEDTECSFGRARQIARSCGARSRQWLVQGAQGCDRAARALLMGGLAAAHHQVGADEALPADGVAVGGQDGVEQGARLCGEHDHWWIGDRGGDAEYAPDGGGQCREEVEGSGITIGERGREVVEVGVRSGGALPCLGDGALVGDGLQAAASA